jgi:uncharacterized phage protein (TIGR01671 family)
MKREIKFRAFFQGKMVNVNLLYLPQMYSNSSDIEGNLGVCPIMQFTGLLDKTGKEIYEGDILKVETKHGFSSELLNEFKEINNLDSINGISMHFVGIVRVDLLRGLMFENPKNSYQEPMFTRMINTKQLHSGIEIIGNIYEHKELLI